MYSYRTHLPLFENRKKSLTSLYRSLVIMAKKLPLGKDVFPDSENQDKPSVAEIWFVR